MYKTVTAEVEVDVDLSDFSDEELIEELESRDKKVTGNYNDQLYYWLRDQKDVPDYVRDWCFNVFGRIL
jgi:hypothetical protein